MAMTVGATAQSILCCSKRALWDFEGLTAVVTGGSKGIGRGIAKELYKAGCTVIVIARNVAAMSTLVEECPGIAAMPVDIEDVSALTNAFKSIERIDLLVNNAGVINGNSLLDATKAEFDNCFNVNVRAPMICIQAAAKSMIAHGKGGAIVNVSSILSIRPTLNRACYATSKAALDMLTKISAMELGPHKIRCNSVNPTLILTDLTRELWHDPEKQAKLVKTIPLGRVGEVEDVVSAVLFLLSEQAAMITGISVPIDGGIHAGTYL